jgi:hypothetical protein
MGNGKQAPPPGGPQDRMEIEAVLDRIGRRVKELRAFDPSGINDRWDNRLELLQKNVNKTIGEAVGMGSSQYRQLAIGPLDAALESVFGDRFTLDEMREEIRKAVNQAVMRLNAAGKVLERRLAGGAADSSLAPLGDAPASNFGALPSGFAPLPSAFVPLAAEPPKATFRAPAPAPTAAPAPAPESANPGPAAPASEPAAEQDTEPTPLAPPASMNTPASSQGATRVAIVCRDDSTGEAATTFIAQLGLEPVISQAPAAAAASLESLEALRQTQFALVLQTDRQLEIGFLLGALGRSRICVLQDAGAQDTLPGLSHQSLDDSGLWKLLLARELKKSGLDVDLNKAI